MSRTRTGVQRQGEPGPAGPAGNGQTGLVPQISRTRQPGDHSCLSAPINPKRGKHEAKPPLGGPWGHVLQSRLCTRPLLPPSSLAPYSWVDETLSYPARPAQNRPWSTEIMDRPWGGRAGPPGGSGLGTGVGAFFSLFLLFFFLGLYLRHMEVSRLGVELGLQRLVYTTATASADPSHICDSCRSWRQCRPRPR